MSEILLRQNPDGTWDEYNPYCTIEVDSEEDFKLIQAAVQLYLKIKDGNAFVGEWIPVSEPPKEHGKYLVTCDGMDIPQIRLFEGEWDSLAKVLGWMPLPQKYNSSIK